jgi:Flp pilus assembly protein TadG
MPTTKSKQNLLFAGRLALMAQRTAADKGGNAAVEFSLIMPFLIGLLVPIADYGIYIYDAMQLHLAAQAGMEYAARNGYDPAGITNATVNAATPLNLDPTPYPNNNNVTVSEFCGCPDANYNIVVVAPCSPAANAARPHCNNDPLQPVAGVYVNVTATYNYHTLINYPGVGIPSSQTLSSGQNAVFRLF